MWRFKKKLFGQVDTIQSNAIINHLDLNCAGTDLYVQINQLSISVLHNVIERLLNYAI